VPYVRVTRDERGYESIFLLHVRGPGDRPCVLYWFRSAPGVRVGRSPLDEDAIRALEERYPEIEFDWEHLIEASTMLPPEVERRPERPHRRPSRAPDVAPAVAPAATAPPAEPDEPPDLPDRPTPERAHPDANEEGRGILDELVGREIAARLRARYADLVARLAAISEADRRADWAARADALNPDRWQTPDAILDGVRHADQRFDELRREMP
jgi:hypothetical protein